MYMRMQRAKSQDSHEEQKVVELVPNNKMDYKTVVLRQCGIGVQIEKEVYGNQIENSQTDIHK